VSEARLRQSVSVGGETRILSICGAGLDILPIVKQSLQMLLKDGLFSRSELQAVFLPCSD